MDGAVAAVRGMVARGWRVQLCTSPILASRFCAQEKFEWVREHLGEEFLPYLIMTADKTGVYGDVLVDDKPCIKGAHSQVWTQVQFEAPYNLDANPDMPRIRNWSEWEEVISRTLDRFANPEVRS